MEREQILEKVLAFLAGLSEGEDQQPLPATEVGSVASLDSIAVVEIVMFLEEEFGLMLDRSDLDEIETAETVADLVLRKQSAER